MGEPSLAYWVFTDVMAIAQLVLIWLLLVYANRCVVELLIKCGVAVGDLREDEELLGLIAFVSLIIILHWVQRAGLIL